MNSRKHHFNSFLLFFIFSCVFILPKIEAFPYQTGWPKTVSTDIKQSCAIADLDNDGFKEIVFTGWYPLTVHIYTYTGQVFNASWPKLLTTNGGSAPTLADLDGDGDLEIIVGGRYLFAWHHTGEFVDGFPTTETSSSGYIRAAPAVGDLTGDGIPEIAGGNYDCEFYVWDNQGNVLSGFPKNFVAKDGGCAIKYTPAIGDIDLDGINEVVIQTQRKRIYSYNADGSVVSGIWDFEIPPYGGPESDITMGDIDGDNILEVLFIAHPVSGGGVWPIALNHDTSYATGWPPLNINNPTPGGLVMGDIDDDGKLEVITGTKDLVTEAPTVYVFEGESGQIKNGWPVVLPDCSFMRNMILGDVNGDGAIDVLGVMLCDLSGGKIYAWDVNGIQLSGFPIVINGYAIMSTCFIDDIDKDGDVEIGVAVTDTYNTSKIMIWDLPSPYKGKRMPWPQDRHDPGHTNNYHWYRPLPQVPALLPLGLFIIVTLLSVAIYLKTR